MGSGATHFSISLSKYISTELKVGLALEEKNSSNDFVRINEYFGCFGNCNNMEFSKTSLCNTLYFNCRQSLNKGFKYVVKDFGSNYEYVRNDFLTCNIKIIYCNLSPWKISALEEILSIENEEEYRSWKFIYSFGDIKTKKQIERRFKIDMLKFPYSDNAFILGKEEYLFFERSKIAEF